MKKITISCFVVMSILVIVLPSKSNISNKVNNTYVMNSINEIEKLRTKYKNNDIVGRLIIEGLDINVILTQSMDNEYYLNHDIEKKENKYGNAFVDYRVDINNSKQINIYGHNSRHKEVTFSFLDKYLDEIVFNNNKFIYLETDNYLNKYEVVGVVPVKKDNNEHMKMNFNTDEEWLDHFYKLNHLNVHNNKYIFNGSDELLVLQTCLYDSPLGNYLIINAKKV